MTAQEDLDAASALLTAVEAKIIARLDIGNTVDGGVGTLATEVAMVRVAIAKARTAHTLGQTLGEQL